MAHQLVLDVPEDLYEPLLRQANRAGKKPEELAALWLARAVALQEDRLRRWAGALDSGVPDAALRHDDYLGASLRRELPDTPNG